MAQTLINGMLVEPYTSEIKAVYEPEKGFRPDVWIANPKGGGIMITAFSGWWDGTYYADSTAALKAARAIATTYGICADFISEVSDRAAA